MNLRELYSTPPQHRERERKENHFKICPGRGNRQFEKLKVHPQFLDFPRSKYKATNKDITTPIAAAAANLLQSWPTLCDPIDGSPPGSSAPGILQARTLEWVAISFSNACMHAKLLQSCLTLCDPMDSSPPGSSVHRIL